MTDMTINHCDKATELVLLELDCGELARELCQMRLVKQIDLDVAKQCCCRSTEAGLKVNKSRQDLLRVD